jgi:hypothetical protein
LPGPKVKAGAEKDEPPCPDHRMTRQRGAAGKTPSAPHQTLHVLVAIRPGADNGWMEELMMDQGRKGVAFWPEKAKGEWTETDG